MVVREPDYRVLTETVYIHEHPFEPYAQVLRETDADEVTVPKCVVPALPQRFSEHYPALGMVDESAVASYRDVRLRESLHVIEYLDHWVIHIDVANPRYPETSLEHATCDARQPVIALLVLIVIILSIE